MFTLQVGVYMMIYTHQRSKKRKVPKKQADEYQQWLDSVNSTKTGFSMKPRPFKKITSSFIPKPPPGRESVNIPSVPDTVRGALAPVGIMRDFHKLSKSDREIVKNISECVAPMHKGNLVYVTPGINPAGLGRKNEVL